MKKSRVSAAVLAGGTSKRMGRNKALLPLGGRTMVEEVVSVLRPLFDQVMVVTNQAAAYPMLTQVEFVADCIQTEMPNSLVGLYSALKAARGDFVFVVPCDMPFISPAVIQLMMEALSETPIVVPYLEGHYQPLHSFYHKSCIKTIEAMLAREDYQVNHLYDYLPTQLITEDSICRRDPYLTSFFNVNTDADYQQVKEIFESRCFATE